MSVYLLISAFNDVVGLGHEANLQQDVGLEPGRKAVHFSTWDSRVLLAKEREKPEETNRDGGKL